MAKPLKDYIDADSGFHCLVLTGPTRALCGYVGIPCEHPMFEMKYSQCLIGCTGKLSDYPEIAKMQEKSGRLQWDCSWSDEGDHPTAEKILRCHGGITYDGRGVEGMKEHLWYFGFDCSHSGDNVPGLWADGVWRDEHYVTENCNNLVDQLKNYVLVKELPAP